MMILQASSNPISTARDINLDTMDKQMIQTQRDDLIVKDVTGNTLNVADDFHAVDDESLQRLDSQSRALF